MQDSSHRGITPKNENHIHGKTKNACSVSILTVSKYANEKGTANTDTLRFQEQERVESMKIHNETFVTKV